MTHRELVEIGYKWLMGQNCGFAFKELRAAGNEVPDVIGFKAGKSILIECKTSRSDFLVDKKKLHRVHGHMGMGDYRFFLCPKGMIAKEELPEKWGLIYENKGKARLEFNPYGKGNMWSNGFEKNIKYETLLLHSALRRVHLQGLLDCIYDIDYSKKLGEKHVE